MTCRQKKTWPFRRLLLLLSAAAIAAPAGASGSDVSERASKAPQMSVEQLVELYRDRSWIWTNGAGFFSGPGRNFTAWSTADGAVSVASGRWFPTSRGKICFRAVWVYEGGAARATNCFLHRIDGRAIYQRREPDGEWYVFDNFATSRGDERAKLVPGDRASRRYKALLSRLQSSDAD